jgi:hypothetical protein
VIFGWQNVPWHRSDPAAGLAVGDLQVTPLPADTHTARMDLVFSLRERWTKAGEPAGIGGAVEFRTDVFDADSIQALIERLKRPGASTRRSPNYSPWRQPSISGGSRSTPLSPPASPMPAPRATTGCSSRSNASAAGSKPRAFDRGIRFHCTRKQRVAAQISCRLPG